MSDAASDAIQVTDAVAIPRAELTVRATRSGGPGGQHVNTSSTRIEITWNVAQTRALTEDQRARVISRLGTRLSDLIRRALAVPTARTRTRVPRRAVEARLEGKRRHRERKQQRRWKGD